MKRTAFLAGIGLLAFGYLGACWLAGRSEAEEASPAKAAPSQQAAPVWADELAQIRRQLGGGALAGSLLEAPGEHDEVRGEGAFVNELQRLTEQQQAATVETPVISESYLLPQTPVAPGDDGALKNSLRSAARLLDDKANLLEFEEDYDRADQCRMLAKRLRQEARELASGVQDVVFGERNFDVAAPRRAKPEF